MTFPTPTKTDATGMRRYVRNILRAYDSALPYQHAAGEQWYPVAHYLAGMLFPDDIETGAGVIAALSIQTSWEENIRRAKQAADTGEVDHLLWSRVSVARILDGEKPEAVLPMGKKTGHFYRCILDPNDPFAVVIDRHAHDVAVGIRSGNADRGLSNVNRYEMLREAYILAAAKRGVLPNVMQAVTWTVQVDMYRWDRVNNR